MQGLPPSIMHYDEQTLRELLRKHFGWTTFRPLQLEAIQAVLRRQSVFVRSATGSGKSLIWQLATLARGQIGKEQKLTVVIYPTKALLLDQESNLRGKKFKVACLHGDLTPEAKSNTFNRLELTSTNPPDVLLTLPEFMKSMNFGHTALPTLLDRLQVADRLSLIVMDEAQQVLQWGEVFRGAYLDCANVLAQFFSQTPCLALSAAITEINIQKTVETLGMKDYIVLRETLDHPAIYHEVRVKESKHISVYGNDLRELLKEGQGLMYCATRKQTEELCSGLLQVGIRAEFYHGGREEPARSGAVTKWMMGEVHVLVATVAFMFGIDHRKVRWVVWDSFPSSVENWVQGSGRAGRDGKKAWSIVYYKPTDQDVIKSLKTHDNVFEVESLNAVTDILHNSITCRRYSILTYFGETPKLRCDNCDNCLSQTKLDPSLLEHDVTEGARNMAKLLQNMEKASPPRREWVATRQSLVSAILGKKTHSLSKLPPNWDDGLFGCQVVLPHGALNAQELTILVSNLVKTGVFLEKQIAPSPLWQRTLSYFRLGPKAEDLLNGTMKFRIHLPAVGPKAKMMETMLPVCSPARKGKITSPKKKVVLPTTREVINGKEVDCIIVD